VHVVLLKLDREKFVPVVAEIVICTFIFAAFCDTHGVAASGQPGPFDASYLEAAAFVNASLYPVRQATATKSKQQVPAIFGMETDRVAEEVAAKWRVVEADIRALPQRRSLSGCRTKPSEYRC
jgi:hypothetical protein